MGFVSFSLLASSLGLNISFATIGWIRSVAILVTVLPISISGIGTNILMVVLAGGLIDRRWLFRHGEKVETKSKT